MSSMSSSSGIYFTGLASNIDTDSIVTKLMQIEQSAIKRLQNQQSAIQTRQNALSALKARLSNLSSAASALNSSTAFETVAASSSDTSVATVTASSGAQSGTYSLKVSKLAQSHKIGSAAKASATQALGLSAGTLVINGKGVSITETDSLTTIATKINSAKAGVTASIIDGGAGSAYLTLTSNTSGAAGKIQISDFTGSIARTGLGLISGSTSFRETISGGVTSIGFSDANTKLGALLGATSVGSKTFNLNGTDIAVDFDNATLADVATAINNSGSGATASVRTVTTNGTTVYKLDVTGVTSHSDADGALEALGILQRNFSSEVAAAQDASFILDGIAMSSATNTLNSVIPNVTLTLKSANEAAPKEATINLSRDSNATVSKVKSFVSAYNEIMNLIAENSKFDSETYQNGVFFGDSVVQQVEAQIGNTVFAQVKGLTTKYNNLAALGLSYDNKSQLQLDESMLTKALAEDPEAVAAVFKATGKGSNDSIVFVSSTSKTVASGTANYTVEITQLATQGSYTAETAQTDPSILSEILTFNGAAFGNTEYTLYLDTGSTLTATINKINSDAKLKDLVTAVNDGGKLKLVAKKYGSLGNFTVKSNQVAASNNSGIGTSGAGVSVSGLDVAGTINGEEAVGMGQFLTGKEGNATTSGLQIQYSGSATGVVGTVNFVKGVASMMYDLLYGLTDSVSGIFATTDKELQAQYDSLGSNMTDLQERLKVKETELRTKFSAMEAALSKLQNQQAQLTAMLKSLSPNKTSG